jgi:hypothetical protein
MDEDIRNLILDVTELSLEAQLRAVRRLRATAPAPFEKPHKSMSHLDMVVDVLKSSPTPLHVTSIMERIRDQFGVDVNRESLVSSLTKKVAHKDRFRRTDRNTFGLIEE